MKPRAHAKLKTLPPEAQAQIAEFARTHTLVETAHWLQASGLNASKSTVSEFLQWCRSREDFDNHLKLVRADILNRIQINGMPDEKRLAQIGTVTFSIKAIEDRDPRAWETTQLLDLRRKEIDVRAARSQLQTLLSQSKPNENQK